MTDSGGRSISLSRDKTIPAAPQATPVGKNSAAWNVLWPVLRRQTFKQCAFPLLHDGASVLYPRRTYWGVSCCAAARSSFLLTVFLTLDSQRWAHQLSNNRSGLDDVIFSQSLRRRTFTRADAAVRGAASAVQTPVWVLQHMTFTPVTSGLCTYCSSGFDLLFVLLLL